MLVGCDECPYRLGINGVHDKRAVRVIAWHFKVRCQLTRQPLVCGKYLRLLGASANQKCAALC